MKIIDVEDRQIIIFVWKYFFLITLFSHAQSFQIFNVNWWLVDIYNLEIILIIKLNKILIRNLIFQGTDVKL